MASDNRVNDLELEALNLWLQLHGEYSHLHPFNEVIRVLERMLSDLQIDDEERAELLWICDSITNDGLVSVSRDAMQILHGIMQGLVADSLLSEQELRYLQDWMEENCELKSLWPYDELEALLTSVLEDGVLDKHEHEMLMSFLGQFCELPAGALSPEFNLSINGVCAVCPEVAFTDKQFCFTGESSRMTRQQIEQVIIGRGGVVKKSVTKELDYLVIGDNGNPCWAFACYGRKVEQAMKLRKSGSRLLLVHENDFWDAM